MRVKWWPEMSAGRSRRPARVLLVGLCCLSALFQTVLAGAASADPAEVLPRNDFGDVGLVEMPSARMAPDGELSVDTSFFQDTQHYNLGFQALPWLAATFRYSGLAHFDPAYPVYYDRSFALKARLWEEDAVLPSLAVGIDDLVGTGVYSGEYVVATKQFGDLEASLGLGWGRLGSTDIARNPLSLLSSSFDTRPGSAAPGGTNFKVFFHGRDVGVFGGLIWHAPFAPLALSAEYSSDRYVLETMNGGFKPRSQVDFGASYQVTEGVRFGLNWLYGRSIGANVTFAFDPTSDAFPERLSPPLPAAPIRSDAERQSALEALLKPRQPGRPFLASQFRARQSRLGQFVDLLWQSGDPGFVELNGHTLILAAAKSSGGCRDTAGLAQAYGIDVDVIRTRGAAGANRCLAMPAVHVETREIRDGVRMAGLSSDAPKVMVIDAAPQTTASALANIRRDVDGQHINLEALSLTDSEATLYYANGYYLHETSAKDRLVRVLMADAPATVEKFRLVAVSNGVPAGQIELLRATQERSLGQDGHLDIPAPLAPATLASLDNPVLDQAASTSYPRFSWDIYPQLRPELFDPNNPLALEFLVGAEGKYQPLPGLAFNIGVETSVFNDFNTGRPASSLLPHVRSDFLKYFSQGKTGIRDFDGEFRFRLSPDILAVAKAGYLESMFAGAGGEVLWWPAGQRWAIGADLYDVWQRDFDRLFGLQSYHVFTGHVSLYYAAPWYDLHLAVRAGHYLAGDDGVTFEVSRRFSTGVEIGAFITRTNVSSARFGEGSFDKGIIIRIPLGFLAPLETQGRLGMDIRPVQRDGGQRLVGDTTLFEETRQFQEPDGTMETQSW